MTINSDHVSQPHTSHHCVVEPIARPFGWTHVRDTAKPSLVRVHASGLCELLDSEASGGFVLVVVAAIGLVIANSPAASIYFTVFRTPVAGLSLLHWINDGLMSVFFLLIGLEIKRELLGGELTTWPRRILPGIAAAGGMVAPALVFVALNAGTPGTLRGWAIPTATDIPFVLAVLAVMGSRVPASLRIFVTVLAIIDDLGGVMIIALFVTSEVSTAWLGSAALMIASLALLNRVGVKRLAPYLLLGAALWFCMLNSGVHASIAGFALALTIPTGRFSESQDDPASPLRALDHALNPWVAFLIVPLFGFANAGVRLSEVSLATLLQPLPLGIAAGLFLGKQAGVFLSLLAAIKLKFADGPENASLTQLYGVSILCGIGFTMSLFIGLLAFSDSPALQDEMKIGVLSGSLLSALVGMVVLWFASSRTMRS
jgi:NhaA family Na+:H+ antiporter